MAQQRLWVALLVILLLKSKPAESTEYVVGDELGWTYGIAGWENGKIFYKNNVLDFKYDVGIHNVVKVSRKEYDVCQAYPSSKVYASGHNQFTLTRGGNYFICSMPGHCAQGGMKISIYAF